MLSKATASLVECLEEELTDHQAELERLRTQFQNLGFQLDTALSPPELKKEISADEAIYISFYDDAVAEELAAKDEDELDEEDPEEVEREDQKETHPSDGFVVTIARRCNDGQERRLHLYCDSDKDGFQLCHIDVERPDGRKVPQDPNEVPRLRERFYGYLNDAGINDHFGGLMQRLAKATIHQQDNLTWMKEMQLFFSPTPQETPNIEDVTSSESIQEHQSTQTTQEHEQK